MLNPLKEEFLMFFEDAEQASSFITHLEDNITDQLVGDMSNQDNLLT
jgi:hypothetical protein